MVGRHGDDRLHRDTRCVHRYQDKADAFLWPDGGVGADEAEDVIGKLGMGGPDLGTVDDIVVAILDRRGLETRQIRAGTGLRIPLAPVVFAGQHARQVVRLLFLGTVLEEYGREHTQAEGNQTWRTGLRKLFVKNVLLGNRPARTTMFNRPGRYRPPFFDQDRLPAHGQFLFRKYGGGLACFGAHLGGQPGSKKGLYFGTELLVFGGKFDFHCSTVCHKSAPV